MTKAITNYSDFFGAAFYEHTPGDRQPFDYQTRLATEPELPSHINIPTGAGKTNAVLGAWMWRRLRNPGSVGRRLVYCLPMRTLVEQTRDVAGKAIAQLEQAGMIEKDRFKVRVLMGGDVENDWESEPEHEYIIIGTQDMLLSRALNRGYALSPYKWPIHFGLLNNDCLWSIDEVQLLGSGLATTLQLQSFRRIIGAYGKTQTIWMSATMEEEWLMTADFEPASDAKGEPLTLTDKDFESDVLSDRWKADKSLRQAKAKVGETGKLVDEVVNTHKPNSMSLVIVNTVKRARELHSALEQRKAAKEILLIHSRFRPFDRKETTNRLLDLKKTKNADAIIVSTQVVEAGVDISAKTLFTELAPWPSLVQRFGRCNREGEYKEEGGSIIWIDVPQSKKEDLASPYDEGELTQARKELSSLQNVGPERLDEHRKSLSPQARAKLFRYEHAHVIRQHDLHGLFSNERDLAGGFTDVSHFVRNRERDADVQVFWKYFKVKPSSRIPRPRHDELCAVRSYELDKFLEQQKGVAWEWNGEAKDGRGDWEKRTHRDIRPGMTLLLSADQGGYSEQLGWTGEAKERVLPIPREFDSYPPDSLDNDQPSQTDWLSLSAHLRDAEAEAKEIVSKLGEELDVEFLIASRSVVKGAWWHDTGKAFEKWQIAVEDFCKRLAEQAEDFLAQNPESDRSDFVRRFLAGLKALPYEKKPWAKFPDLKHALDKSPLSPKARRELTKELNSQFSPRMRHEAASALAAWQEWQLGKGGWTALAVYLVVCHHGKVRTVLRSMSKKNADVFGIKPDEVLPALPEWLAEDTKLNLQPRAIGSTGEWNGNQFIVSAPSWMGMIAELLGPQLLHDPDPCDVIPPNEPRRLGAFRLAFLEALIRAADARASSQPGKGRLR